MTPKEEKRNIVIIGGGIIGCTSAYFLSRHTSFNPSIHTITLLESSKIAGGASGKAGGLLALWAYPKCIVPLSFRLHAELAKEHGGAERWGYRRVNVGGVECRGREVEGLKGGAKAGEGEMDGRNGEVEGESVSLKKRSPEVLERLRKAGLPEDLDWVAPECDPQYDFMGDTSTTAQVHPYQFTTAMAELAAEKGVDIRIGARVTNINYTPDGKGVESVTYADKNANETETTLPATDIIIAAGPWTRNIYPSAPIAALRAHSVTIKPSRPVSAFALFTHITLPPTFHQGRSSNGGRKSTRSTTATPEIYARPHNEVYACGEGDTLIPLPSSTEDVAVDDARCQDIIDQVSSISDELREGTVTARQACYLPNVEHLAVGGPLTGETGVKGVVLAAGHTCWGIQNAPGTGKVVGEIVFEGGAKSAKVGSLDPRMVL